MTLKNKIEKIRNELLKAGTPSNDKILPILSNGIKKFPKGNYEKAAALRMVFRYIAHCKSEISAKNTLDQKSDGTNHNNFDIAEIRIIEEWILKKYIEAYSEFLLSIFIADLSIRKWIDEDYETRYLQIQVDILDNQLEKESDNGNNIMFEINNEYLKGIYPDVFKWDKGVISFVEASIGFRKYLKEQLAERNPNPAPQQISIQGEIKGEKDAEGNLIITLPLQQIESSIKESIKLASKENDLKQTRNIKDLLTRKETMAFLKISSQTLSTWTKNGTINAHRIGNKHLRYKREDIEKAVQEIRTISFDS
jgi:excisionase family DNA binding protein